MKDKKLRISKCRECIHLWFRGLDMQGNTYIAGSPAAPNSCRICALSGNVVEDIDKIEAGCPLEDYGVQRRGTCQPLQSKSISSNSGTNDFDV